MPDDGSSKEGSRSGERCEHRSVPRYPFIASSREIDAETGTELAGRVSEISERGCFIDTLNPFPAGSRIGVTINHSEEVFNAISKVIYVIPNMGMGVKFIEAAPEAMEVLRKWLRECA